MLQVFSGRRALSKQSETSPLGPNVTITNIHDNNKTHSPCENKLPLGVTKITQLCKHKALLCPTRNVQKDNQHSSILFLIIHKCHRNKTGVLAARDLDVGKGLQPPWQQRWCVQLDAFTLCRFPSQIMFTSAVANMNNKQWYLGTQFRKQLKL